MAKGKPTKKPQTPKQRKPKSNGVDPKYIFVKPTTKNQRLWNKQIARLARFQKKYVGVQVQFPEKPDRVTKEALKEISGLKGRKILERSTVNIKETKQYFPNLEGTGDNVNAAAYYEAVAGNRPLNKGGAKALRRALAIERNAKKAKDKGNESTQTPIGDVEALDENKVDIEFIDNPEYNFSISDMIDIDDTTLSEFRDSYQQYRPEFRELMDNWLDDMLYILGSERALAEYLRQYISQYGGITRAEAYDEESLRSWERKFIESLPYGSELRKRGEVYLNQEYENDSINTEAYEEIQARSYMHDDYITAANFTFKE